MRILWRSKELFAYIFHLEKKIFKINVNIYNLSNSFINVKYCSSAIPPRRRSSFNTGNSLFFIISLPFFVNSVNKAPNTVRNPFNDVSKNGIPWPILTTFSTLSNLLSFSNCSSRYLPHHQYAGIVPEHDGDCYLYHSITSSHEAISTMTPEMFPTPFFYQW